jgi:sugar phosphate isomerase/epimerase
MARLGISQLTTFRWSFEEDVAHYRSCGVNAIGVWRQKLADIGEEQGAELLAESGLEVTSLQWAGGFTGSDGRSHDESLHDARQALKAAEILRAGCLIVHSGARGIHTHSHARRLLRLALDKLLPVAEEHDMVLAVEPMQGECGGEFTFLNCLDESIELIESYRSSALKMALDTYHWGHQDSLPSYLPELAPKLALVQLGDSRQPPRGETNHCLLGEGLVPLRKIVCCLTAAGYDGPFEVELMGEEIEASSYDEIVRRAVAAFQEWTSVPAS